MVYAVTPSPSPEDYYITISSLVPNLIVGHLVRSTSLVSLVPSSARHLVPFINLSQFPTSSRFLCRRDAAADHLLVLCSSSHYRRPDQLQVVPSRLCDPLVFPVPVLSFVLFRHHQIDITIVPEVHLAANVAATAVSSPDS